MGQMNIPLIKYFECSNPDKRSWLSLGSAVTVSALAGTGYAYGSFNPAIKTTLGYEQKDITLLGSVGHCGMFLGVLTGTFYDMMGSQPTLVVGSLLSALCYFVMYLQVSLQISSSPLTVCIAYFFANLGNSFRVSSTVAVCIKNFPHTQRGKVVGLAKGYFALGASLYSQIYLALFREKVDAFFLFIALELVVFTIICLPYFVDIPYETGTKNLTVQAIAQKEHKEKGISKQLNKWYLMTLFLIIFLTAFSLCQRFCEHGAWNKIVCLIGLALIGGVLIYLGNMKMEEEPMNMDGYHEMGDGPSGSSGAIFKQKQQSMDGEIMTVDTNLDFEKNITGAVSPTAVVKDLPVTKAVLTIHFWILFLIFFLLTGCCLVLMNNIAQIKYALTKNSVAYLEVTIMGVGSLSGRMIIGFLSDTYKKKIPREGFLLGVACTTTCAMAILCINKAAAIIPACIFTSLSYGGIFCMLPSLIADYYGSKYYAGNYGAADLAPAASTFVYATAIVNFFYKDVKVGKEIMNCYGSSCFGPAFIICFFSGCAGILASFVLLKMRHRR